ncbi:hypothetical protein AAGS61_02840 [Lysinibacillus sp. KU-BSD001]|uniref:rolling circle replication-associated protein n=1 Tax=Lysinibacillus sp. KU-BSD001 TaxID=3141328 RepID=UPI0036F05331
MTSTQYNVENYEDIFTVDSSAYVDSIEEHVERLRDKQISKYRVKSIWSGNMLEIEAYPLWAVPIGKRGKRGKGSSIAQQNLNDKNTIKRVTRIVHTNFTEKDIWATWTYANDQLPADHEQAKKDMQNFIRRLKRWLKKQKKYEKFELKYVYVTEFDDSSGKKVRVHHHMITNFPDRDVAEELWNGGGRVQTRRLQPNDFGLEGLVRYIMKDKKKKPTKRYTISRNMKQPKITIADSKMTRKRAERIAMEEVRAQELFEKMYQGYKFNDIEIKYSEFNSGVYLYVRMKRIDTLVKHKRRLDE